MSTNFPEIYIHDTKKPVGSIYCIGKNYADHVAEMNYKDFDPVFFQKPRTSLKRVEEGIRLPQFSDEVHHELEVVLYLKEKVIAGEKFSLADKVSALGLGLDLTARDVQSKAKEKGKPWLMSKGFDGAAVVGNLIPLEFIKDINNLFLKLTVNGEPRQSGNSSQMIYGPEKILKSLSEYITLYPGDLIFTGTPAGVSPLKSGDELEMFLSQGEKELIRETVRVQ